MINWTLYTGIILAIYTLLIAIGKIFILITTIVNSSDNPKKINIIDIIILYTISIYLILLGAK